MDMIHNFTGHGRLEDLCADRGGREGDAVARAARHVARRDHAREGTRMKRIFLDFC